MAEIVLKIGVGSRYEDGDVLEGFNTRRIRGVHAEHLTSVRESGFTRDGLRPEDCLARKAQGVVYEYRFIRVSQHTVARETLEPASERVVEYDIIPQKELDAVEFLERRLRSPNHRIFGEPGREFWFGGRQLLTSHAVEAVWDEIEANTDERRTHSRYELWPAQEQDLKSFLWVPTEDFDEDDLANLERSVVDPETGQVLHKRAIWTDWPNTLGDELARMGVRHDQLCDKRVPIDLRRQMRRQEDADRPRLEDRETGKPVPRKSV